MKHLLETLSSLGFIKGYGGDHLSLFLENNKGQSVSIRISDNERDTIPNIETKIIFLSCTYTDLKIKEGENFITIEKAINLGGV
jgi:hypothetical protein